MRAVIYSTVLPAIAGLTELARSVGVEPVAVITPRAVRDADAADRRNALLTDAPAGLDLCFAADKASLLRLTSAYEPELGLCAGSSWLLPPEVLAVPRLGVVNSHPSLLPRHRGPYPFAWAIRDNDPELGLTVHLMDEDFDTGPILAQGSRPMPADVTLEGLIPTLRELNVELVPKALQRLLSGDRGDPQTDDGATYAARSGRTTPSSTPCERVSSSTARCERGRRCGTVPSSGRSSPSPASVSGSWTRRPTTPAILTSCVSTRPTALSG